MNASINFFKAARGFCAFCVLLAFAAFSSAAWAQAGYVHEVSGTVSMQKPSTRATPAKVGDTFESETVFRTGIDGRVTLKFADGQIVALGADSTLRIGQYRFVANNIAQSTSTLALLKGEMRYVAGVIGAGNREGVRISAGESTVSILKPGGADFTVMVKNDGQEHGVVAVTLGEVAVRTPYGQINKIAMGQFVPWQPGRALPLPAPLAAAPAVIQAAERALLATALPSNTPVAIEPAARAAVAAAAANQAQAVASADPGSAQFRAGGQAGYVHEVSGTVSMQRNSGSEIAADAGYAFDPETQFRTGTDGKVTLKFADGQIVVLGLDSTFRVGQYRFVASDVGQSASAVELMKGEMRFVTGVIGTDNPQAVRISAGDSTISILKPGGADFTVVVDPDPREVGVSAVAQGEVSIRTPYGQITRVATGQFVSWQPGAAPPPPAPIAAAPAAFQAAESAMFATALPDNTPVEVALSARAATATAAANQAQAVANADPANAEARAAAQAAAQQADAATQAADAAAQSVDSTTAAAALAALPATAAGPPPTLAQAVAPMPAPALPTTVTPGASGGGGRFCVGSPC